MAEHMTIERVLNLHGHFGANLATMFGLVDCYLRASDQDGQLGL